MRVTCALLVALLLTGALLIGCTQGSVTQPGAVPDAESTTAPLVGVQTRADVEQHSGWEQLRAQDYTPDAASVAAIRENSAGVDVLLFLGTWCSDSTREVPRFFKIMDLAGWDESRLTIIALDRTKVDAEGLTKQWDIEYVPTFVLLRDGSEVGRIVERPGTTLEGDIAAMLAAD